MQRNDNQPRPVEWPRDDSWLFADPMSIGGQDTATMGEAWNPGGDREPRRGVARSGSNTPVFVMAGALAGVFLGTGVALLAGLPTHLDPVAVACPETRPTGPDPVIGQENGLRP